MKHLFFWLLAAMFATAAFAQDWALRDGESPLTALQTQKLMNGLSLTYHDDGESRFSPGGSYSYTYAEQGGTAFGRFWIEDDGRVCIAFRNGFDRCDIYVRSGGRLILLTQQGERYPVKIELGVAP
jgi:hypothetical protein